MHHVILSGGLDSTAALAQVIATGTPVRAISFDYGQRHRRELRAAVKIAGHYSVPHLLLNLTDLVGTDSSLTDPDAVIPEGRYDAPSMSATVVQGRNLLFASAAITRSQPGDTIVTGVHAGDHPIYADCRPDFWEAVSSAADAYGIMIATPFLYSTKAEVAAAGAAAGAPLEMTWSCYAGGDRHCGRCGTCVERAEAFDLAGVADPTEYADPDFWRAAVREPA